MATIRELIIRGRFETGQITAGVRRGVESLRSYASGVEDTVLGLSDMAVNTSRVTGALDKLHGSAAIGLSELSRGIAKVSQAGTVGAFAMREFTGAAFRLGEFLGPAGPLIPVVGLLGFAFYEMFKGAGEQAEKTRKKFEEEFKKMVDALDQSGLRDQLRSIEIGRPSAGAGQGGGFAGSIRDLVAQRNEIVRQIQDIQTQLPTDASADNIFQSALRRRITVLERYWRDLGDQLRPLREQQQSLRDALLNPTIAAGQTTPAGLAPTAVKADSITKAIEEQAAAATRLAGIYDTLNQRHQASAQVQNALLRSYDGIVSTMARLRAQGKGLFDPMIESLLKAQQALEKSDIIQALRVGKLTLAVPGLTITGGARPFTPTEVVSTEAKGTGIIDALLRAIERRGGVTGAPAQTIDAGRLTNMIGPELAATFRQLGDNIKTTVTGSLVAAFGPVAVLMRALEPAIQALTPLFDRLAVPIALVARVLVASLEPILRALFPILRALGIAAAFVGEIMARVSAAIAQAMGGLIKAIGNLIARIPGLGGVGHAIANFGQSMLNFAEGQKKAADEFARTRRDLQNMTWDGTALALDNLRNSAQGAADALTNIPQGFRIQRAIFLASQPVNAQAVVGAGSGGGATNYFAPGSIVIVASTKSGAELLNEVSTAARQKAMTRTGTTADAARVIG